MSSFDDIISILVFNRTISQDVRCDIFDHEFGDVLNLPIDNAAELHLLLANAQQYVRKPSASKQNNAIVPKCLNFSCIVVKNIRWCNGADFMLSDITFSMTSAL